MFTIYRKFDQGVLGAFADGTPDGFDGLAADSKYVDFNGRRCAELLITQGTPGIDNGFGSWGGEIVFPETVGKGGVFYFSCYYYLPSTFDITNTGNGTLKFLRFYTTDSLAANKGALDILMDYSNVYDLFRAQKEFDSATVYAQSLNRPQEEIPRDQWFKIEVEVGVDDIPRDSGGNSYLKMWRDGILYFDDGGIQTLDAPGDFYKNFLLHTNYNNGSPQDQVSYVDDIYISNSGPQGVEFLVRLDNTNANNDTYSRGDIVTALPIGTDWGSATTNPRFAIITVNGLSLEEAQQYIHAEVADLPHPNPSLAALGRRQHILLHKRRYQIPIDSLPTTMRDQINSTRRYTVDTISTLSLVDKVGS